MYFTRTQMSAERNTSKSFDLWIFAPFHADKRQKLTHALKEATAPI